MNCPSCGAEARPNHNFCTGCGARFAQASAPPRPPDAGRPGQHREQHQPHAGAAHSQHEQHADSQQRFDDMRPKMVPVVKKQVSPKTLVLKNAEKHTYVEVASEDVPYLKYLDGKWAVSEILKEIFEATGQMSFKRLYNLLVELYVNDILYHEDLGALEAVVGGIAQKEPTPLSRFAAALKNFEIPIPQIGFLLKALSYPMMALVSIPAQIAFSIICVLPVMIAGFLASDSAKFLGGAGEKLLSVMGLFAAPSQKGHNIFMFNGSYIYGMLVIYLAAFCVLSYRSIFRGAALLRFGCEPHRPALRIFYGIFYLDVDGRDIAMAGKTGRIVYHAAGITSTLVIGTAINIIQHINGFSHPLYLIYIAAYAITFFNCCVFFKSDLFMLLDTYFELPRFSKSASVYIRKKFFQQLLSFRTSFPEENALTTIASLGILWMYLAVNVFFVFMRENLAFLAADFKDTTSTGTKIVIVFIIINLIAPFITMLVSLVSVIARNIAGLLGGPAGRMFRRFAPRRGRTAVDAAGVADFLAGLPLFAGLPEEERADVAAHMAQADFRAGSNIVVQGDDGDAFYVILEGDAEIIVEDNSGVRTTVDTLRAGDSFGEIALLETVPRTATIRALTPLTALELEKPYFDHFVERSGDAKEKITEVIRLTALLRKIPFFREMSPSRISRIMSRLRHERVKKGQTVIREGSEGDRFYIIADGVFTVLKNQAGASPRIIAKLKKNDWFGEIALLRNIPRTSTVVAETDGLLMSIDRREFLSAANASMQAGLSLESETERRLAELKQKKG